MRICQSKDLEKFTNNLNQRFRLCCYNGICRFAPTGENYITFVVTATTKKVVIEEFKRAIMEYTNQKQSTDTIYWRKYSELKKYSQGFKIYSRLLISSVNPSTDLVSGRVTMQQYMEQADRKERIVNET